MTRWIVATAIGLLVLCEMLLNVPAIFAGAFDDLSPGNQKGAQALFEAQRTDPPPGTRRLTLDEIAARKQSGQGWGRIFDDMKSSGLVDARNFGQTVSSFNHRHHVSSGGGVTTAANRTVGVRPQAAPRRGPDGRGHGVARNEGASSISHNAGAHGHAASTASVQTHARAGGHGQGRGGR